MPVQQEEGLVERIMARPKTGFDAGAYNRKYQKTLKRILLSFNPKNPDDVQMWEYIQSKGDKNRVPYIKKLIREDMKNQPIYVDTPKIGKLVIK